MTSAIMIIDTWDKYYPGLSFLQTPMERTVLRISKVLQRWQGPIVLAAYQTELPPDQAVNFPWKHPHHLIQTAVSRRDNTITSWNTDEVNVYLKNNNVNHLYYTGFSIPGCIEHRELGIHNMTAAGYKCEVVVDCCLNLMSHNMDEADIIHETYKYSITSGYKICFGDYI